MTQPSDPSTLPGGPGRKLSPKLSPGHTPEGSIKDTTPGQTRGCIGAGNETRTHNLQHGKLSL